VETPDLFDQELLSDNEIEKSIHDGGNLKHVFFGQQMITIFDA
jgi:hypothetical protein